MRKCAVTALSAASTLALVDQKTGLGMQAVRANGESVSLVSGGDDEYNAFAENTLKVVANAVKREALGEYREACMDQPNTLSGVEYSNFDGSSIGIIVVRRSPILYNYP